MLVLDAVQGFNGNIHYIVAGEDIRQAELASFQELSDEVIVDVEGFFGREIDPWLSQYSELGRLALRSVEREVEVRLSCARLSHIASLAARQRNIFGRNCDRALFL